MTDPVLDAFLTCQQHEGLALAAASDLLSLEPLGNAPARRYHARFTCKGLVRSRDGHVEVAERFELLITFPDDYLRRVDGMEIVTWLEPINVHQPAIAACAPVICLGRLYPGTPLVDILYQVFEIITYNRVTMREDDALNPDACAWARRHRHLFPIDRRPLKRSGSGSAREVKPGEAGA